MAKIFLSYNRVDVDFARRLVNELEIVGHSVFSDFASLAAGSDWREALARGLRDADGFIALLSNQSLDAKYLMTEIGAALTYSTELGRPVVIPIMLDDSPIPSAISHIQVLSARDKPVALIVQEISEALSASAARFAAREIKAAETAKKIDTNISAYVEEAISAQRDSEKRNGNRGKLWYLIGFVSLIGGILLATISIITRSSYQDWVSLIALVVTNVVMIGFLGACSRYAFALGKAYTSEGLKASDRIHAIAFGKFYLRAFEEKINWTEVKEVFQYWNIDRTSTFSTLDSAQIDPQILTLLGQLAATVGNKVRDK
jgi:hypothetical protein